MVVSPPAAHAGRKPGTTRSSSSTPRLRRSSELSLTAIYDFQFTAKRRDDIREFLRSVPTAWIFATLRDWKHRDKPKMGTARSNRSHFNVLRRSVLRFCRNRKIVVYLVMASKLSLDFGTKIYSLSNIDAAVLGMQI